MRTIAINNEAKQNLNNLLGKMKSKTKTEIYNNDCCFNTTYVTGGVLKNNNNGIFGPSIVGNTSTASLNGNDYIIDNETGAVKAKKTSLRERLLGVSKKTVKIISDTIEKVKENFENNEVVKQYSLSLCGFTKKGADHLQAIIDEVKKNKKES